MVITSSSINISNTLFISLGTIGVLSIFTSYCPRSFLALYGNTDYANISTLNYNRINTLNLIVSLILIDLIHTRHTNDFSYEFNYLRPRIHYQCEILNLLLNSKSIFNFTWWIVRWHEPHYPALFLNHSICPFFIMNAI